MMFFSGSCDPQEELQQRGEYQPPACARQDGAAVSGERWKQGMLKEQGRYCSTKTIRPAPGHQGAT